MNLTKEDMQLVCNLLKDYQWHMDHYHEYIGTFTFWTVMSPSEADALLGPYQETKQRIQSTAPFAEAVFSGELPKGFSIFKTAGEEWYAWSPDTWLALYGPVSEFQARLWCWKCLYVDSNGISANALDREKVGL